MVRTEAENEGENQQPEKGLNGPGGRPTTPPERSNDVSPLGTPLLGTPESGVAASPFGSPTPPPRPAVEHYPPPTAGLINQGCTCYLNSLLQVLFHIGHFRSAVYRITVDRRDESALIPQALQELFFQMQERKTAPSTKGLTDAFGWDEREVFVQHDIQELAAILRDCLEGRMRGTPSEGAINRLFEGTGEQVVQTLDGSYTSRSKDTFYDIHLPIQNFANVIESLRSLIQKDQLVGDNKYKVEEEGKPAVYKDAEKGYRFVQFPPVIFFHLKRFEMDLMSPMLEMKKVNTAFEFSEELDLREFETSKGSDVAAGAPDEFDRDSQAVYDLVGVIVHRGTARSGHYYCYIRHYDTVEGRFTHWIEYEDENVRVVDADVAIDANFGGVRYSTVHGRQHMFTNTNNAYILSYVRRADRPIVLAPSPTDIIPDSVKRELRRVMEADVRRAAVDRVRRQQIRVVFATDETIAAMVRSTVTDLMPREERLNPTICKYVDVKKNSPFVSLYQEASDCLGRTEYPRSNLRFWKWQVGADKVFYRPILPQKSFDECSSEVLMSNALLSPAMQEKDVMAHVIVYVERMRPTAAADLSLLLTSPQQAVRLFVKAYTPRDRTVSFLGPMDVHRSKCLIDHMDKLAALLGVDESVLTDAGVLIAHEGNRSLAPRFLDLRTPIHNLGLIMGDIIIVQPSHVSIVYRSLTVVDIIHESRLRFTIQIRDIKHPLVLAGEVQALYTWDYESVCDGIAKELTHKYGRYIAADHIHLHRNTDCITPTPCETPLRSNCRLTASDMCAVGTFPTNQLFFALLDAPRTHVERVLPMKVRLFNEQGDALKDVVVTAVSPVSLQDVIRMAVMAPPAAGSNSGSGAKAHATAERESDEERVKVPAATEGRDVATAPTSPEKQPPLHAHYVAQFVFEGRSRPIRLPIDVSMAEDAKLEMLQRNLCLGEWIFFYPSKPLEPVLTKPWTSMSSDDDEPTGESSSGSPSSDRQSKSGEAVSSMRVRIPVAQGEYMAQCSSALFFGNPFFVDVDPLSTTVSDVLEAVTSKCNIPSDSDELLTNPMMLVVEDYLADADMLLSERDVDSYFYRSRHYRFIHLHDKIYQFLTNHDERFFVYLNRKRPKEKPGSRYIATNDPKLTLEKKKPGA